jgi:signal transduction histidine kinase
MDACIEDPSKEVHRITFSAKVDNDQVLFDIADNGVGMDNHTLQSMFNLFFSAKGKKGTGLGLFIAKKIIEQHGGTIIADSVPGEGTRFSIEMPKNIDEKGKR